MSDFTERARAEAERTAQYEMCAMAHRKGFMAGVRWARRELLADPTDDEVEDAGYAIEYIDQSDDAVTEWTELDMARAAIAAFLEARRGSE